MLSTTSAIFFVSAILLLFAPTALSVQCWTCASDLDPRCGDPFNATVPRGAHGYSLTNCDAPSTGAGGSYPYVSSARSVCKKTKQLVNGDMTVIRACAWQMPDTPVGNCPANSGPGHIRVIFCETCDSDACNGAINLRMIPALLIAPLLALFLR